MPRYLKSAMQLPLLKKANDDFEEFANFLPICNLKYISKLIEKAVFAKVKIHLTRNGLHEPLQSAYKTFYNTETALLMVQNDIMLSLDKGENAILVLLDLSATFDTVNHSLLLSRLYTRFGISGTVFKWFRSYLSDRTQFININEAASTICDLLVGVPQGSVLGTVLYLMYTSPTSEVIKRFCLNFHQNTVDTQLYLAFKSDNIDMFTERVVSCVANICRWIVEHYFNLNQDKTEILLFHSKFRNGPSLKCIHLENERIP